ncbi:MAG: hypothetical protein OK438_05910 [Thaumarchaeota archaeon]|nr:hypothetical protein [Nitrososphaerota archaeon]
MTSPRRSPGKPIESVQLRITFKADRATAASLKKSIPFAVLRDGGCEVKVEGESPGEVAERAREMLEILRGIAQTQKGYKQSEGLSKKN